MVFKEKEEEYRTGLCLGCGGAGGYTCDKLV